MSDHAQPAPGARCQNCGAELRGPFCHECGQQDFEFHRSFRHVFLEALENFAHFDAKFFRNIITLLFQPGRLTADFNAGKRASQMPPFRLYLFISVLFFFIRFLGGTAASEALAGVPAGTETRAGLREPNPNPGDGARTKTDQALSRYVTEKSRFAIAHQHEIQEAFVHALPRMLLLCLPLFALYTRLLFWRSGQVYLQHLIVALHYHTFVYLWWLVARGWSELAGLGSPGLAGALAFGTGVWMFLYPFVMLRRLFNQSWTLTSLKALVLTAVYGLTLSLGFALTAVAVVVAA